MVNEVAKSLYLCTYLLHQPLPLPLQPLPSPHQPLLLLLSSLALLCFMSTFLVKYLYFCPCSRNILLIMWPNCYTTYCTYLLCTSATSVPASSSFYLLYYSLSLCLCFHITKLAHFFVLHVYITSYTLHIDLKI